MLPKAEFVHWWFATGFLIAPGLLITPHVAARTEDMAARVYQLAAKQLHRFLAGEPLLNQVVR